MPSFVVMPFEVGIDLVSHEELEEMVQLHGARYLERIYTEQELADCGGDLRGLAVRFAAKEATVKALRLGDEPLHWRGIGVHTDRTGRPSLRLTGAVQELARKAGVTELSVSLTHERHFAAAVVLAEVGPR
jgi:holo-[acyl-carrier protein] synthase